MPSTSIIARMALAALIAVAAAGLGSTDSLAQRYANPDKSDRRANKPGDFDYYALVLSWSPTYCASQKRKRNRPDRQCDLRPGKRPYAFVLHGLWPQYEKGYPERCYTPFKPFVPKRVINGMLDIMPSPGLVIHQYKKHGTCSGLKPAPFFGLSRNVFRKIKIPQRYVLPEKPQTVSPDTLVDEFVAANSTIGLRPDMMAVQCGGPGNRLREIRICFDKTGKPTACGRNENQRRLCNARRMYVPPVRVSAKSSSR